MPRFEYQVIPTAESDAETALNWKDAVKSAKRYAKENGATCLIDVYDFDIEDKADFYFTVSPNGEVQKQ